MSSLPKISRSNDALFVLKNLFLVEFPYCTDKIGDNNRQKKDKQEQIIKSNNGGPEPTQNTHIKSFHRIKIFYKETKHNNSNDRFLFQAFRYGFLPYMFTAVQYSFLSLSIPPMIWYVLLFLLILQSITTVEGASVGLDTTASKKRRHMIIYIGLLIMFSTNALATTYSSTAKRKRRTVGSIFHELGMYYTRRAY